MIKIKKIHIKVILLAFILILLNTMNNVHASYDDFSGFNNAPRMTIETNKNKYTDVKLKFVDYNGLSEEKIKIYKVTSDGKKTEISNNDKIITKKETSESDNSKTYIYTLSNEFLNKETTRFYISLEDNSGEFLKSYFRIMNNGKEYSVDYAPRILSWKTDGKKVSFTARDLAGTVKLVLYDMNNNGKVVVTKNNLKKGNATVTFNISKFKAKDGIYRIQIYAKDKVNGQPARREVCFKLPEKKENTSNNTQTNTATKNKEIINVTINKKPTKKNYVQNLEELDLSGGEIKVTYDDGSSKLISMTNNKVSCSGFSNEKVGTSTVTIKYENRELKFDVNINKREEIKAQKYNKVTYLKKLTSAEIKSFIHVSSGNGCTGAQSMCVAGDYIVAAKIRSGYNDRTLLRIYDKNTGKKVNDIIDNFLHAGGMTYNSKENKIYVALGHGSNKYSYFKVGNLAKDKKIYNKTTRNSSKPLTGIAYDEYLDKYYISSGNTIFVMNGNLKYEKRITRIRGSYQDIGAYKGIILATYSNRLNAIDLYRESDGAYIGSYKFNIPGFEIESVDYYKDNVFFVFGNINGKNKDKIFKVTLDLPNI